MSHGPLLTLCRRFDTEPFSSFNRPSVAPKTVGIRTINVYLRKKITRKMMRGDHVEENRFMKKRNIKNLKEKKPKLRQRKLSNGRLCESNRAMLPNYAGYRNNC